jgi:ubiquinone/menaquinone biosynthesis C-methylase UbiE
MGVILQKMNKDDFDYFSHEYDAMTKQFGWSAPQKVASILGHNRSEIGLLDLGIGTGQLFEHISFDGKAFGVDYSEEMLKICKSKFPDIETLCGDLEKGLPFRDSSFDIITACGVFDNVYKLEHIFYEVYRTLRPSGLFCFTIEDQLSQGVEIKLCDEETGYISYQHSQDYIIDALKGKFKVLSVEPFLAYYNVHNNRKVTYRAFLSEKIS